MEMWKDVIGYEGLYEVSENGAIRGKDRKDCRGNRISGVEMKPRLINSGYYMVHLRNGNGERKGVLVHRVVAAAFLKPKKGATQVDHIDENKANNAASNLRWVTPKENTNHGTGKARAAAGRSVPVLRLSEDGMIEKKIFVRNGSRAAVRNKTREYYKLL